MSRLIICSRINLVRIACIACVYIVKHCLFLSHSQTPFPQAIVKNLPANINSVTLMEDLRQNCGLNKEDVVGIQFGRIKGKCREGFVALADRTLIPKLREYTSRSLPLPEAVETDLASI